MTPERIYSFKSNFIFGSRFLSQNTIEIDDSYVTIKQKMYPFSQRKYKSIPLQNIIEIKIKKIGTGASILIQSYAKSEIFCKGLSFRDALKIKNIILG